MAALDGPPPPPDPNLPDAIRQGRAVVAWFQACRYRRQSHQTTCKKTKKAVNEHRHVNVVYALRTAPELFAVARPLVGQDVTLVCFVSTKHKRVPEDYALHVPLRVLARAGLAHLIGTGP